MDKDQLQKDLLELARRKTSLSKLNYNDSEYDRIEEELHVLEDDFMTNYGEFVEEALLDIHDEYCPDNDVLSPIAYLAQQYIFYNDKVDVDFGQGVLVDVDDYPNKVVRLVLVPSPVRVLLTVGDQLKEEIWSIPPGD